MKSKKHQDFEKAARALPPRKNPFHSYKGKCRFEEGYNTTLFLRCFAPDFCYCTAHELYLMAEVVLPDVLPDTILIPLSRLHKLGFFHRRKVLTSESERGPRFRWEYIRIKPSPLPGMIEKMKGDQNV